MSSLKDKNKASYNQKAEAWAAHKAHDLKTTDIQDDVVWTLLDDLSSKKVLSLGCGTGEELNLLKKKGAKDIVAIDASKEMIKIAKDKYPDVEFILGDMDELDFGDRVFDYCFSSMCVHYSLNLDALFEKLYKSLKEEGTLLFSTQHPLYRGAERTLTDKEDSLKLGFERTAEGELLKVWGDYSRETERTVKIFGDVDIYYIQRPIEKFVEGLLKAGFNLKSFKEPVLSPELEGEENEEILKRFPSSLIIKAQK